MRRDVAAVLRDREIRVIVERFRRDDPQRSAGFGYVERELASVERKRKRAQCETGREYDGGCRRERCRRIQFKTSFGMRRATREKGRRSRRWSADVGAR